ncbi:AIRC-domain-containing protein [Phlegmacium glaucopus]|nr:AIRC-domain-containing protein [Phlegmacium glaucopus]
MTALPVIGVPVKESALDDVESLHSIVQTLRDVPVATVAINNGTNALDFNKMKRSESLIIYRLLQQSLLRKGKGTENAKERPHPPAHLRQILHQTLLKMKHPK